MRNKIILLLIFYLSLIPINSFSQEVSYDQVVMLDGEEKIGQVTEIGDSYIKFVHKGQKLSYTLKKENINKIQFASGRIEFITEHAPDTGTKVDSTSSLQEHHNSISVLPFNYIGQGGSRDQKMGMKIQSDCYNVLKKYADQFTLQDPITTSAIMIKHNINEETVMGFTPAEVASILDVEYVIYGTVTINENGTTTGSGNYTAGKNKGNKYEALLLGSSSTTREFTTTVDMKIYTDQGQNIFAQTHQSFWQTENAYNITLQYLIKRTPLYRK